MILIHTRQSDDTTIEIIQWLQAQNKTTFRLNFLEDYEIIKESIAADTIQSVYFNGQGIIYPGLEISSEILKREIHSYLKSDAAAICENLLSKLANKKTFGVLPYPNNAVNKLNILEQAGGIGFKIPDSELVSNKENLIRLKKDWGRIICKAVVDGININTNDVIIHGQQTEEITDDMVSKLGDSFFPTYIQRLIEKQFEIRSFFYNGKISSIAIFSQNNEKSLVDGRALDTTKPQRRVPFILPNEIEIMIKKLMPLIGLNYGSLDFIVTQENEFYFLEVNPYGQYGFVSIAGNYYLEKQIAESL